MNSTVIAKDANLHIAVLEQALSQLGQGIILLSNTCEIQFMTQVAQDMIAQNDGLSLHEGKLIASLEQDNERLQRMLNQVATTETNIKTYKNFYIHRKHSVRPYWLMLSKIVIDSAVFGSRIENIMIVIKDIQANNTHWENRLKATFGLTNREANFVVLLTEGRNIKEIGVVMDIAEDTARQYLKNAFKKMDVNKQHELVCLALDSFRKR